ncbi:MAG: hypothetical protein SGPRY_012689, partial [Prymnesium sp.]
PELSALRSEIESLRGERTKLCTEIQSHRAEIIELRTEIQAQAGLSSLLAKAAQQAQARAGATLASLKRGLTSADASIEECEIALRAAQARRLLILTALPLTCCF